jgi:hypothetical protein
MAAPTKSDTTPIQTPPSPPPSQAPAAPDTSTSPEVEPVALDPAETQPPDNPEPPTTPVHIHEGKDDPLLKSIFKTLGDEPEIEPAPEEPEPPAEPPKDPDHTEDKLEKVDPEPTPEPKAKKKTVTRAPEPAYQPPVIPPAPSPAPIPPPKPAEDPDEAYIASLSEEQQEELAEAEYAEAHLGEKFKGQKKKLLEFYRQVDGFAQKFTGENFEEDEDWKKLVAKKPKFTPFEAKKVERGMIEESVYRRAKAEHSQEVETLRRKTKELELRPQIAAFAQDFRAGMLDVLEKDPNDPLSKVAADYRANPQQAIAEHKINANVIDKVSRAYQEMAVEFTLFNKQVRDFDEKNPALVNMVKFINQADVTFQAKGGVQRVKEGKQFVTRQQWLQLQQADPGAADKYWIFSNEDYLEMLQYDARRAVRTQIQRVRDEAKQLGLVYPEPNFQKPGSSTPAPEPTPAKAPTTPPPPKAAPSRSKGAAPAKPKPGGPTLAGADGFDIIKVHGLKE